MRIDFNILWVEDQPTRVQAQKDRIDHLVRKEGFRLRTKFVTSVAESVEIVGDSIYGDHIDLVLMDYDLGAGTKGDEGLVAIRELLPFKEMVFYSANAPNLAELVAEKRVQGVYCSTRGELPDEVFGLFESLIKKVLDIDHARGIVMGSSSDIDGLVFDSLGEHFRNDGGILSESARQVIAKHLKDIRKRFEKDVSALESVERVEELHDLKLTYTSMYRHRLLRKLLEKSEIHEELCTAMKEYVSETLHARNILAHARVVPSNGFARVLYDNDGNELTGDSARDLRLKLLKHQEDLERLLEQLKES